MINHWQWVITAFLGGITLSLCLEIRRQRQTGQPPLLLYVLPAISLFLAAIIGLPRQAVKGDVISPPIYEPIIVTPTLISSKNNDQASANAQLPPPQISLHEAIPLPSSTAEIENTTGTAVRRLKIPALKLNKPVNAISLENGEWDVSKLGSDVGWLESTAPGPNGTHPMVFVGHMTFANQNLLEEGAFAHIPSLAYGSVIILETEQEKFTYRVDFIRRVLPDDVDALYQETGDVILLLTCADWNPLSGTYANRLLVRATRDR